MIYDKRQTIICLMGPTASGKSDTALYLAQYLNCEIISVDSAMVYRGMNIGTAKPTPGQQLQVPHHLVDIKDPADIYSAAQFRTDALRLIKAIFAKNKIPLLVGGTMLYFHALIYGLSELPQANQFLRDKIFREAQVSGWAHLHARLAEVDPCAAAKIKPTDPQRIQRALEIYELTGKPMTDLWHQEKKKSLPFNILSVALQPENRSLLHQRIADRFEVMLQQGFVEEVAALFKRGDLHANLPSMRCVGYRQVWEFLAGVDDYDAMKTKAIAATRQLAKRQLTWLRSWPDLISFDAHNELSGKKILHYLTSLSTKF